MRKYMTEAHAHVLPASGCSHVHEDEIGKLYAPTGTDTIILTNHFYKGTLGPREYLQCYHNAKKYAAEAGVTVALGMEIRFVNDEFTVNDYLVYGIDDDDVYRAAEFLDGTYYEFYEGFKNDRNVIVQAHPFRPGITIVDTAYLDGIEVFNLHPHQPSVVGFGARLTSEHKELIATGGTDYHYQGHEGLCLTATKKKINDSFDFANALKSGDYEFKIGDFTAKRK